MAPFGTRLREALAQDHGPAVTALVGVGCTVTLVGVVTAALLLWLMCDARARPARPTAPRVVPTRPLLDRVPTGSILLSRHVDDATRRPTLFNRATAASDWYHAGMVVRRPGDRALFVLDCMADGDTCALPCAGHQTLGVGGPRIVRVEHYMLLYSLNPGVCAFRELEGPVDDELAWRAAVQTTRYRFVDTHEFLPKLCEGALERLLNRRVGRRGPAARHGSGVFCSEIVALLLMEMGVLDPEMGAGAFTPWSFCREMFDDNVLEPYRYGPPLIPHVFAEAFAMRLSRA